MTVHRQTLDDGMVLEACDHVGTLDVDHERDVIRCTDCQCAWWPVREWEGGWLGTHTRMVQGPELLLIHPFFVPCR